MVNQEGILANKRANAEAQTKATPGSTPIEFEN